MLTDTEKRLVAYHEVGHALVAALDKRSVPVSKITIVPHTDGALGYTLYLPEEEKFLSSREELMVDLRSVLGGRAAEDVVFHTMTTGAANDLQKATATARNMVALYGMSEELGLMAPASVSNQYLDGQSYLDCSQETSAQVDAAVKRILNTCYADACRMLTENRALLDEISEYLEANLIRPAEPAGKPEMPNDTEAEDYNDRLKEYEKELAHDGVLPDGPTHGKNQPITLSNDSYPRISLKAREGDARAIEILEMIKKANE